MPVKLVKLGDTGPEVSELCLGTMAWGSRMQNEETAHKILDEFVAAGCNFIDTAELYPAPATTHNVGFTEQWIGRWLAKNPGMREKVVITSKVSGPSGLFRSFLVEKRPKVGDLVPDPSVPANLDRASMITACEGILQRLQTTYVDVLYLHWPTRPVPSYGEHIYTERHKSGHPKVKEAGFVGAPLEESIRTMAELMQQGKVRHWAISNDTTYGVCTIVDLCRRLNVPKPICIQNEFSLLDRHFQYDLAETCMYHNISGCPYAALAGGVLTANADTPASPASPVQQSPVPRPSNPSPTYPGFSASQCHAAALKYAALARSKGVTPVELALAWSRQCVFNQSIIVTANSMEQLRVCLGSLEVTLDQETLDAIDDIHAENKNPKYRL